MKKLTHYEVIERASARFPDYDFSKSVYVDAATCFLVSCPAHGEFLTKRDKLLNGIGCKKCYNDLRCRSREDFIRNAIEVHGSKYDYSDVVYSRANRNVDIICRTHGKFQQIANNHLQGNKCPQCARVENANRQTTKFSEFLALANTTHSNKYTYDSTSYTKLGAKLLIVCPEHGEFRQGGFSHINGRGCPACGRKYNIKEDRWLSQFENLSKQHRIDIGNKYVIVDGFNPFTNTIYEFYGDYWHGNPAVYNPQDFNTKRRMTFGKLYNATVERSKLLRTHNYNIVEMWEHDFDKEV